MELLTKEMLVFLVSLVLPMLYYRILFSLFVHYAARPYLREKTGMKIHHLHYGIAYVLIGSITLLFSGRGMVVFVLLGLGLGLMLDTIIPSFFIDT